MNNEIEIANEIKAIIKEQMIAEIMNADVDKYLSFDEENITNLSLTYKRSYITEDLESHAKIRLINKLIQNGTTN